MDGTDITDQLAGGDDDAQGVSPAAADEIAQAVTNLGAEQRLWLRSCRSIIHQRSRDDDPSPRVQLALDLVAIAACERARRILGGDLPGGRDEE